MADLPFFLRESSGTQEEIMKATYCALCEYGYSELTIQRIGEHFDKSKSLLYHHYENKDSLLLEFLQFILDEFQHSIPDNKEQRADERLNIILDRLHADTLSEEQQNFVRAMVELRAQAHDDRYRSHFTHSDQQFHALLVDIIQDGIKENIFQRVEPERVAAFLLTCTNSAMLQHATSDNDYITHSREEIDIYINTRLMKNSSPQ
ncbi:TetR/AcrR family transcriptional regulator [Halospeciosus flavus]|uniref:TetR/AcrR family transcriptional regulator n=1 Tax=Halospeciosus flavus TaxID=3032283 RepID=UPI00361992AC